MKKIQSQVSAKVTRDFFFTYISYNTIHRISRIGLRNRSEVCSFWGGKWIMGMNCSIYSCCDVAPVVLAFYIRTLVESLEKAMFVWEMETVWYKSAFTFLGFKGLTGFMFVLETQLVICSVRTEMWSILSVPVRKSSREETLKCLITQNHTTLILLNIKNCTY